MHIAVIGAGSIGTAVSAALRKFENEITVVDTDPGRLAALAEKGFTLTPASDYTTVTSDATVFCISGIEESQNMQALNSAVRQFAERLKNHKKYHLVVICSTVPPKSTRTAIIPLIEKLSGKQAGADFGVAVMPVYARKASLEQDVSRPWFILVGQLDAKSGDMASRLYARFDAPIERVTLEEAEFQKLVHNLYNATKISFFNEMRTIAAKEGWDAAAIFNATAESAEAIWNPLYGMLDKGHVSGSNIVTDGRALRAWGAAQGFELPITTAVVSAHGGVSGKTKATNPAKATDRAPKKSKAGK